MFKALCLLKRRPGMSMPEFINYYENVHTKFIRHAVGIRRYMRRYVTPVMIPPEVMVPPDMEGQELDIDVVMEMWFDDSAAFEAAAASLYSPEIGPLLRADEEKLFDRSKFRVVTVVEEYETDLSVYQ